MCGYCGCASPESDAGAAPDHHDANHHHHHDHDHHHAHGEGGHDHHHGEGDARVLELGQRVLQANDRLAERVRGILLAKGICAINVVSSPGSGKTTLLEESARALAGRELKAAVLVGDLATDNDARRLRDSGLTAVQITTGTVCHLDAHMILHGLEELDLDGIDLLFFENVGNLVCPASFDLGQDFRVVLSSVTEGEDKPLKYPTIFEGARYALITKTDLSEVLGVDLPALRGAINDVAPSAEILELSSRAGVGFEPWLALLEEAVRTKRARAL